MYWYADNYFPNAVVPPFTMGPIALSALWGGEIGLFIQGVLNGILFAYLMRWFARDGARWRVMTIYVFCYSSCIMCLKYSIFWHLVPLEKIILPLVVIVSVLAKDIPGRTKPVFDLGRGPAGQEGGFAVGTNAKKVASRALRDVFFRRRTSKMEIPDKIGGICE